MNKRQKSAVGGLAGFVVGVLLFGGYTRHPLIALLGGLVCGGVGARIGWKV